MPTGVGMYLGTVEADLAKTRKLIFMSDLQHFDKNRFKFITETTAKGSQCVVVGMKVAGEEAESKRVIGCIFDLALSKMPVA